MSELWEDTRLWVQVPHHSMKKKTQAQLKKVFWKHFSIYIRTRDKFTCVTCGKKGEGSGLHAGHYIVKGACGLDYYFHEKNVHAQCFRCNIHLSGNSAEYRKFLLRKYGEKVVNDIEMNYHKPCKDYDFDEKIEEYKKKLQKL